MGNLLGGLKRREHSSHVHAMRVYAWSVSTPEAAPLSREIPGGLHKCSAAMTACVSRISSQIGLRPLTSDLNLGGGKRVTCRSTKPASCTQAEMSSAGCASPSG